MVNRKFQRSAIARTWGDEPGVRLLQCSDAPDMSGANAAALEQAQLSRDQLAWVQDIYNKEAPDRKAAQDRAQAVSDQQMKSAQLQDQVTRESLDHYRSTFEPIETKLADQAQNYDTPDRREAMAGQAMADVGSQADIARASAASDMASRGVDPSSGAAMMAATRGGVMEAAAKAAAGNQARQLVETTGHAYMADAANLGRNIASSQGTTAGIALNAGNSAVGNSQTALNTASNGVGMVQQGYGTAINGLGQSSQNQLAVGKVQASIDSSNSASTGAAIGGIAMAI